MWILSINSAELIKTEALVTYLQLLQLSASTRFITVFCARCTSSTLRSLKTNRAIFNQIRSNYHITYRIHLRKGSLFENYEKMQITGTFSAPMPRSHVPPGKAILCSHIAFHVKDGDKSNSYD